MKKLLFFALVTTLSINAEEPTVAEKFKNFFKRSSGVKPSKEEAELTKETSEVIAKIREVAAKTGKSIATVGAAVGGAITGAVAGAAAGATLAGGLVWHQQDIEAINAIVSTAKTGYINANVSGGINDMQMILGGIKNISEGLFNMASRIKGITDATAPLLDGINEKVIKNIPEIDVTIAKITPGKEVPKESIFKQYYRDLQKASNDIKAMSGQIEIIVSQGRRLTAGLTPITK